MKRNRTSGSFYDATKPVFMGATLLLKISPPFGRIVRLTLTLCDLKIYHMNWERLKNDRKLMVILTAAVAAVLIIIAIILYARYRKNLPGSRRSGRSPAL